MNKKNKLKGLLEKVAIKVATADANQACAYYIYQTKQPESVKKLRKF